MFSWHYGDVLMTFWCLFDDGPMMFWWCFGDCLESLKKEPTRWISRFSQQIKVSTAPISNAFNLKINSMLRLDTNYVPKNMAIWAICRKHLECVIHTEAVFASVLGNLVKVPGKIGFRQKLANYEAMTEPSNQLFLLDELDIGQRFCSQLNGLQSTWTDFECSLSSLSSLRKDTWQVRQVHGNCTGCFF